jgi:hypothetical protein
MYMRKLVVLMLVAISSFSLAEISEKQQYLNEQLYREIRFGGSVEKMQKWVDAGADVNAEWRERADSKIADFPLQISIWRAFMFKDLEPLKFLLKRGADVDKRYGITPTGNRETLLMYVVGANPSFSNKAEVLKLLLEYGANPNLLTENAEASVPKKAVKAIDLINAWRDEQHNEMKGLLEKAAKYNAEQLRVIGMKRRLADLEQENKELRNKLSTSAVEAHKNEEGHR